MRFLLPISYLDIVTHRRLGARQVNGVDSLLSVTQKVAFMKGEGIAAVFADWSRVVETFGELMELTEDYPRRYRVREFPDEMTIDAIGSNDLS